jgi:hypothetical protein
MLPHRRLFLSTLRNAALVCAALMTPVPAQVSLHAQNPPPVLPQCVPSPDPSATDTWPIARTDSIGTATGPLAFSGATLLANDTGPSALAIKGILATTRNGGTIGGSDPYTYTPAPLFSGSDTFTYEIEDAAGETAIGLVKVTVVRDLIAPAVALASPGATVSGNVMLSATATDNISVADVRFFEGTNLIGAEDTTAPYEAVWNTTLVADGTYTLTAVARDGSGNATTSAPVVVSVLNVVVPPPPPPPPPSGIAVQASVSVDGRGPITTPSFGTAVPGQVLVALAASDGPTSGANNQFLTISGGGLTWTRVQRAAVQRGVAEIWTATAASILSNVTVTSTQSVTSVLGNPPNQSLVVIAFTGATGVGASGIASGASGAPRISLVTQAAASRIYGAGIDFDQAIARTVPAGQTKIHEFLAPSGDTMWMQTLDAATGAAGGTATLNDTAPTTDQWNYAAVEIMSGTPPASVAVPNVVGELRADAEAAIVGADLTVGTVTEAYHATVGVGRVISQSPAFGNSALVGSAVSLSVSLGPAPAPPPPAGGLVLALGFDEASGNTALDSSGNNLNGTIREAARVAGRFGGALSFDGVNDWVTVPDTTGSPLDLTTGVTLEAWVKPETLNGWDTAILKERGAGNLSYALYAHDGAPVGGAAAPAGYVRALGVDQAVRDDAPLAIGEWSHIAMTYDGATMRFYVNGTLVASRSQTGNVAVGNGALRIGGNNVFAGEFFRGLIDEVRVYNRALSAAEIAQDMNSGIQ